MWQLYICHDFFLELFSEAEISETWHVTISQKGLQFINISLNILWYKLFSTKDIFENGTMEIKLVSPMRYSCFFPATHLTLRRLMSYIYMEHLFLMFLDHTQRRSTVRRSPLDQWSARRRDLYLTTHDTHNRQISMPPVGFEPTISAGERPCRSPSEILYIYI